MAARGVPIRRTFNRRSFLRLAGMSAAAAASPLSKALAAGRGPTHVDETISYNQLYDNPPLLGRVEATWLSVWDQPRTPAERLGSIYYDDVVPIYSALRTVPYWSSPHNDIWFQLDSGYVHSSHVVPCREVFHEPEDFIGRGFWGEITVPTSWQHWNPWLDSKRFYDLAYGTIYWVKDRADDTEGRTWYRIVDDVEPNWSWWVQARHVRRIERAEFDPISPDVEDKRIVIDLGEQYLTAYEEGVAVLETRIASGTTFTDDEGNSHYFETAPGEYAVQRKRPSRRMIGGAEADDFYDLPGVPWVSYFTLKGASIHGTYWHNDYGRRRSHGCINVTPDAAKWIYRWVNPYAGYDEEYYWTQPEEMATEIRIVV